MSKLDDARSASSQQYVHRVEALLRDAESWCRSQGLQTDAFTATLREEGVEAFQAPGLDISKDGLSLAQLVPVGSRVIAADGRVDLVGQLASHSFLFYVGLGPEFKSATIVDGQTIHASRRMLRGLDGDGWYWIESNVRKAKRVDESLFIDLFTDVSDYEF
ncbi:hypothetical protein [Bordetella sp. N]|uniref:hypothetical protein n=1 Tax=Bordetella sp. N TaxID=1746199 RepID=UPI000710B8EA|nr:hypothetical protein [Bordetella sp. N]ALM82474.1 hypothetical protein ASB57_05405 [Bordetella sp. N]